jgi:dolichol-phosphate mannosyltransferase
MVRTNVLGTSHLLEACLRAGAQSFVNTGSSSEYGFQDHAPSEDEPIYPNSEYAVTKASATLYCKFVGETRQAPVRTLRLYSVYGPMEDPGRLMPTLVREGLAGRLPPLVDPNVARDFVWVEDVYDAYRLVAASLEEDRGAIYNVGTGRQTSMREVVQTASRVLHLQVEPAWSSMLNRRWDTDRWVCDARKFRRTFGWRPRVDLEEGLQRMATWQREKDVLTAIALPASPTA